MKKLLVCLIFALMPALGYSWTIVPGGIQVNISYTEPNTNSDGTVLRDLDKTQVFYNLGTGGDVKCFEASATALTGNGNINGTAVIPWPSGKQGNVTFYAVALDTSSNVSAKTGLVTVQFDTLSPGAPKILIISGNFLFFSFREPIVNADGSPIDDLASVKVYYNDSVSAALRLAGTYGVSDPAGGAARLVSFPLAMFTKGATVRFYPRFLDTHNNISPFPQAVAIKIPS